MTTTLWDKFKSAVRYARSTTEAAVATVRAAPAAATPHRLLDAASATTSAPSVGTDGADVEGLATLNLGYIHSDAGQTSTITIWVYDGEDWLDYASVDLDKDAGALDALDTEGYPRVDAQLTGAPGAGTITVKVFPHNEDS